MGRLFMIWLLSILVNVNAIVAQSIIVNPDGTHSTVHGSIIVNSDGTHSTIHGNIIVNSDGSHSIVHENVIVNSKGTHSIINNSALKKSSDDETEETPLYLRNSGTYFNRRDISPGKTFYAPDKDNLSYRTLVIDAPVSLVFDRTMDYLQHIDYFLLSLDKQAGFIQAKIYIEKKRVFSVMVGERRTLNFIIRPVENDRSMITLTIYTEVRNFGGDNSNRTYYYEDRGICKEVSVYEEILGELQQYLLSNE